MQKYYINSIASIHPEGDGDCSQLHACEPDYKMVITNAGLRRRMSHIIKMGVACALNCMKYYAPSQMDAIITATGLGCLSDTEKFMNALIDNEERLLNPTPFIQSTPNTIGGQIALLCQIHSYNVTYTHRGFSFETALIDAMMRINEGDRNVLVGAMDEITETSYLIMKRMGLLKGVKAGEGAHFFVLGKESNENTFAQLKGVDTFMTQGSEEAFGKRIDKFLTFNGLERMDIDCLMTGKNGHQRLDTIYESIESRLFPNACHSTFKDICGEYQTASAFALWKAANILKEDAMINNILIYNHYNNINHSLILISRDI
ncbi:beta-ketoacyl synthase chain length factor [uncultured Bacteroides sp.]|uniref:beta-ketoacyl synthase chain length factor n=1 Tax=uncultured Bacteroides sp. TaxID=162156 RepID=UPI002AAAFF39|nr:beta-ketoacyl synthase chain length factor [uncultured Bacteroides sp.]